MLNGSEYAPYVFNETSDNTTYNKFIIVNVIAAIPSAFQLLLCGIVLTVFFKQPSLRTVSNLPVINLVVSDVVRASLSFLTIPLFAFVRTETPSTADTVLCLAFQCISNFQFAWSSWALAIIAYTRSDLIVNVLAPKFNKRRFWGLATVSWFVALLTSLLPFMGWSSVGFIRRNHVFFCRFGQDGGGLLHALYVPFFYFLNFIVPSVLIVICFARIVGVARRHMRSRNNSQSSMQNIVVLTSTDVSESFDNGRHTIVNRINDTIKSKSFRYIVIIVLSNLLLLSPYVFLTSYDSVCNGLGAKQCARAGDICIKTSALLFMLNFNVNAILYIFWIRTFQVAAIAMICCSCQNQPSLCFRHKSIPSSSDIKY